MDGHFCTASPCMLPYGVLLSLAGAVAGLVVYGLRKLAGTWKPQPCARHLYEILVGIIERGAITLIAVYDVKGAGAFAAAWIGLKLASGWNRKQRDVTDSGGGTDKASDTETDDELRVGAQTSMVGSLISALFALAGAMIICGKFGTL